MRFLLLFLAIAGFIAGPQTLAKNPTDIITANSDAYQADRAVKNDRKPQTVAKPNPVSKTNAVSETAPGALPQEAAPKNKDVLTENDVPQKNTSSAETNIFTNGLSWQIVLAILFIVVVIMGCCFFWKEIKAVIERLIARKQSPASKSGKNHSPPSHVTEPEKSSFPAESNRNQQEIKTATSYVEQKESGASGAPRESSSSQQPTPAADQQEAPLAPLKDMDTPAVEQKESGASGTSRETTSSDADEQEGEDIVILPGLTAEDYKGEKFNAYAGEEELNPEHILFHLAAARSRIDTVEKKLTKAKEEADEKEAALKQRLEKELNDEKNNARKQVEQLKSEHEKALKDEIEKASKQAEQLKSEHEKALKDEIEKAGKQAAELNKAVVAEQQKRKNIFHNVWDFRCWAEEKFGGHLPAHLQMLIFSLVRLELLCNEEDKRPAYDELIRIDDALWQYYGEKADDNYALLNEIREQLEPLICSLLSQTLYRLEWTKAGTDVNGDDNYSIVDDSGCIVVVTVKAMLFKDGSVVRRSKVICRGVD